MAGVGGDLKSKIKVRPHRCRGTAYLLSAQRKGQAAPSEGRSRGHDTRGGLNPAACFLDTALGGAAAWAWVCHLPLFFPDITGSTERRTRPRARHVTPQQAEDRRRIAACHRPPGRPQTLGKRYLWNRGELRPGGCFFVPSSHRPRRARNSTPWLKRAPIVRRRYLMLCAEASGEK
ncbi:hypothetical protein GQ53DRAFT_765490 [Thozetella sp. PMI_491]|nr:hypothetical protein GQ53DRAFT_765490 [Thozetella sp. PMI_491]